MGAIVCASKIGEFEESWRPKQCCRLKYNEFECGQETILFTWPVSFFRKSEEDFHNHHNSNEPRSS